MTGAILSLSLSRQSSFGVAVMRARNRREFFNARNSSSHLHPKPDQMNERHLLLVAATSCVLVAGCGGGSKDAATPMPGPAVVDNVLMLTGPAANAVVVTINSAGYLRAFGNGTDQPLTIGLGSVSMAGNANSATGDGWLPSAGTFVQGNATSSLNSGGTTYSLKVQGPSGTASDSTLELNSILVKPTVSSLAGTFG
jgi:hypothetical protein